MADYVPTDTPYWLALSHVQGLGAGRIRHLLGRFGTLERAWKAQETEILFAGLPRAVAEELLRARPEIDPDREMGTLEGKGVTALPLTHPEYPERLRHIPSPPAVLYVRGDILECDTLAVAVVGTRRPTRYGTEATRRIVSGLAASGVTVVSGLALGIDAVAHETALDAGGRTMAVLGSGVDVVYPARHRDLARRIAESGAVLSEYALGTRPDARNFPPRNRIISGMCHGVLVIEAGERSGALITTQFALEQGRDTYAVPGSIFWPMSQGTNGLIKRGEAKLVTTAEDILEEMDLQLVAAQTEVRLAMPGDENERGVLGALSLDPRHVDEIGRESGLPPATVSSTLALLELKGLARSVGGMHYVLVREAGVAYTHE
ncbi:MAG: DNA-protecting protein DprA [Anaerolineae bacterium]|nr:DNA-protecting protein DprA [Anaerolineae bacterium]